MDHRSPEDKTQYGLVRDPEHHDTTCVYFERTDLRRKAPIGKSVKKLLRKAMAFCEKEMKAAVHRRDMVCQVCFGRGPYDVDHWISRRNKSVYFDINNLTLLCKPCHTRKSYEYADYPQRVTDAVQRREGEQVMEEIRCKSRQIKKWTPDELNELAETYKKLWV